MVGDKELTFRCCFCNTRIEESEVDPADINIMINLDKSSDQQYNQTMWCHTQCFRSKLHDDMKSYMTIDKPFLDAHES